MAHTPVLLACLWALLAVVTSEKEQSRWSRQISSYTSDISDWVPLTGPIERESIPQPLPPIKKQAVAEPRILSEPFPGFTRPSGFSQDAFPPRNFFNSPGNRQLYLQSVPSAPQNYLTEQGFGQSVRLGLSQPNFPLSQGFIAPPQFGYENIPASSPQIKSRPQPTQLATPTRFDGFAQQNLPSAQPKPFVSQPARTKPDLPKFVDGYRVANFTNDFSNQKKKVTLETSQKIKFENYEKSHKLEPIQSKPKVEREEVQLLYVPLESLNRGQFNFRNPVAPPQDINTDLYSQSLPKPRPLKQMFANDVHKPQAKPADSFTSNQNYYSNYEVVKDDQVPKYSTISPPFATAPSTTPKPKKLKPHQPPLAIFMTQDARKGHQPKVGDVLSTLKNANSIAVLDTVNPANAPKVFIGPSSLKSPDNFVKFELPYLSNIENSDKKLRQLPFFVAPLSYNTPTGFAKIPFPSPHVGSVVINSLIKETTTAPYSTYPTQSTPAANIPNSYTATPRDHKTVTQKPNFSYYSTSAPNTNNLESDRQHLSYYSIEPQTVTAIPTPKDPSTNLNVAPPKPGSYFLTNVGSQYNPTKNANLQTSLKQEPISQYFARPATTSTPRAAVTSTTSKPSTYSSQLLETHNPYSINQAFHFSTPLDYHTYYDEYKDPFATPAATPKTSPTAATIAANSSPKPKDYATEKQIYQQQSSPNYLQNYTPEIHYESEVTNPKYPIYNTKSYNTKTEVTSEDNKVIGHSDQTDYRPIYSPNKQVFSQETIEYNPEPVENLTETIINKITSGAENNLDLRPNYDQYQESYEENHTSSTTSTTTTTRRTPLRSRGRPKYTTTLRPDSVESTTSRVSITRKPIRERRPLPSRSRYESNKVTTEKSTRKPVEPNESTTKSSTKSKGHVSTRGRIHYKPSENDDIYNKRNKLSGIKEEDLAYQRDVLHQNYPVTLMERMSTVDIEAMTEPTGKGVENGVETYDTENAYAHNTASISFLENTSLKEQQPLQTETYAPDENTFVSKLTSSLPEEVIPTYEENNEKQENNLKQTTPEAALYATEQSLPNHSVQEEYITLKQEETPTLKDIEITKIGSQETYGTDTSDNVVQTTPSYNRVRVRPGVVKQYHQTSSTESSRSKSDRKKVQAITYRPAFDRRRTTMRIEEIEADLKTKQIHSRPDFQDYKHPVYKPDPTSDPTITTASILESTTKRGHFRRRRPVYTTTSTESSSTKKSSYEVKSRFRGRRPTDKTTERHENHVETTSASTAKVHHSRYSQRTRLSERYNKKPENEAHEIEDQDPHHSINIPKYAAPENDEWSPKFTGDSFKPYNPNDIPDDSKLSGANDGDLDIITARNDYDDILLTVTPATNNRSVKKIPDIPPTLEALVEQTKTTKTDTTDSMSTFETMLEQVMKSLEEQDEDEYNTKVMKHKGGEIGEIPPERIISSGDEYTPKATTVEQVVTTLATPIQELTNFDKESISRKSHRRGYWKKVKVRPVSSETIETAESQYYANAVNQLGQSMSSSKVIHDKFNTQDKPKHSITTYKPSFQFIKDYFDGNEEFPENIAPAIDIPKIVKLDTNVETSNKEQTDITKEAITENNSSPGDVDLGTGSPDPTIMDSMYISTQTEPTSSESVLSLLDRSDGFSFMDYFFGTSSTKNKQIEAVNNTNKIDNTTPTPTVELTSERKTPKVTTTDTSYIPEEITAATSEENVETTTDYSEMKNVDSTEKIVDSLAIDTTSESSFMNPANVMSTSMSTEVSHETEICFRGKCIKTNKDVL
ncbi:hypothetical protein ACJJTC_004179 [Scirpophaga incertulas]